MLKVIVVIIFLGLSVYSDHKTVKIRNSITVPFMIIGLIINLIEGHVIESVFGMLFPFFFFLIFWRMRLIGAGDVKEFMGMGAVIGVKHFINVLFPVFFIQLVFWIIASRFSYKVIGGRFKFLYTKLKIAFLSRELSTTEEFKIEDAHTIKMSYGIFVGYLLYLLMHHYQFGLIFDNLKF